MEQHYVFLKNNRVANIAVFALQDEALADAVAQEHGFDDAIWVGETIPAMWSTYDGTTFADPTDEYLISIGIKDLPVEEEIIDAEIVQGELGAPVTPEPTE